MHLSETDPLKRFSNRVENYVKYRPGYPISIMNFLKNSLSLKSNNIIADVGSGTGILSEMLLKNDNTVYAVEPNNEMREAAEKLLKGYKNFISVNASAESTGLKPKSIDFITSAQAFHWFDQEKAKIEFKRILKDAGWVVLIWNSRLVNSDEFMVEYEKFLLKFSTDYSKVNHANISKDIFEKFFKKCYLLNFPNKQSFDFEGLKGRLLSSSYAPDENSPDYELMIQNLNELFQKHQINGIVEFIYNTEVYFGNL